MLFASTELGGPDLEPKLSRLVRAIAHPLSGLKLVSLVVRGVRAPV